MVHFKCLRYSKFWACFGWNWLKGCFAFSNLLELKSLLIIYCCYYWKGKLSTFLSFRILKKQQSSVYCSFLLNQLRFTKWYIYLRCLWLSIDWLIIHAGECYSLLNRHGRITMGYNVRGMFLFYCNFIERNFALTSWFIAVFLKWISISDIPYKC